LERVGRVRHQIGFWPGRSNWLGRGWNLPTELSREVGEVAAGRGSGFRSSRRLADHAEGTRDLVDRGLLLLRGEGQETLVNLHPPTVDVERRHYSILQITPVLVLRGCCSPGCCGADWPGVRPLNSASSRTPLVVLMMRSSMSIFARNLSWLISQDRGSPTISLKN